MKDIEFELDSTDIHPNSEIKGIISVSYPGRYDGVVINTQIFVLFPVPDFSIFLYQDLKIYRWKCLSK